MLGKLIIQGAKVISVFIILIIIGCKPESLGYSNVPEISLSGVEVLQNQSGTDSLIQLVISYQDGDGDIGLSDSDTAAPYNVGSPYAHNLPITFMVEEVGGGFVELVNKSTGRPYGNNHARIPVITPTSKFKAIDGSIVVNLTANPAAQNPSKVFLKIKLIDRALNVSNEVQTQVINLTH